MSGSSSSSSLNQPPTIILQSTDGQIQFPIPPSSFEVAVKQNNSTVSINNLGELNMLGKTGLVTMSFSSFFPAQAYSFCQCTAESDPYSYAKKIDTWRTSGQPLRFTISGTPINYAVSIDGFKYGEKDGSGDVYFTLDMKEYKFIGGAVDNTTVKAATGLKDRQSKSLSDIAKNITVYPGDSIMDIASKALGKDINLGDSTQYLQLYKSLAKQGKPSAGTVLKIATGSNTIKVGNLNVHL